MKNHNIFILLAFALVAMAGCKSDDDREPADLNLLVGHWYAEIPLKGEVKNWRTEEEEMTTYDHVGAVLYFNTEYTSWSWWGYLYIKDGEMVNFDGISRVDNNATFDYTVDPDYNITTVSKLESAPVAKSMRYSDGKIYAEFDTLQVVFTRPDEQQSAFLEDFWEILVENGIVGYEDEGQKVQTEVTDENATEESRAAKR